ncbi:MAG: hypothetical protein LUF68_04885 [Clostridiales bacterium]|nr:hypothetical protein [Clostridiales bacterium]
MYILQYSGGAAAFETVRDVVTALQVAEPMLRTAGQQETARIQAVISRGGVYDCGSCRAWATEGVLP